MQRDPAFQINKTRKLSPPRFAKKKIQLAFSKGLFVDDIYLFFTRMTTYLVLTLSVLFQKTSLSDYVLKTFKLNFTRPIGNQYWTVSIFVVMARPLLDLCCARTRLKNHFMKSACGSVFPVHCKHMHNKNKS